MALCCALMDRLVLSCSLLLVTACPSDDTGYESDDEGSEGSMSVTATGGTSATASATATEGTTAATDETATTGTATTDASASATEPGTSSADATAGTEGTSTGSTDSAPSLARSIAA